MDQHVTGLQLTGEEALILNRLLNRLSLDVYYWELSLQYTQHLGLL